MKLIKTLSFAAVALFACVAGAASASAHEFSYSGTVPTALEGSAVTAQEFKAGFGTVTCTALKTLNSTITTAKTTAQLALIDYTSCKSSTGNKVKEPVQAHYEFLASEEVKLIKPVTFELEGLCTIEVSGGPYGGVKYENFESMLRIVANVSGITYKGTGICGSGTTATYKGTSLAWGASGGVLSWA